MLAFAIVQMGLKRSMNPESQVVEYWVVIIYHFWFEIVMQALRAGFGMTSCFVLSPLFSWAWQRFLAKCGETSCYPRSQAVHQHCNPSSLFSKAIFSPCVWNEPSRLYLVCSGTTTTICRK